ncbi:FAD-binding and (Fe-S)-binding domain-containing protein [Leeuwenhoekiella marinoflava]|uniref:FAD/FMN-containing dehydrogenase n=2 Tax=Leeuwenhoekiella marinoflava TaxID=988 RepID=A0A4Q0PJY6_9FLAO|nr:FAD-binding and (Fe-S)-binding domain-containing protein [Leeuwenhoekiella marinoflava]RXG28277.1 FAD/FMN-containing dehydrogenase [Leeuwenhoekiella marinoflava]SHF57628.1 FAD/FMN-containing dehydrogenase [Leeuwenhoekiella marinoflava DSM 3653]
MISNLSDALKTLAKSLEGDLVYDDLHKHLYATDASVYRRLPVAVAFPENEQDLKKLILFAGVHQIGLIPRTAGTSLAGQCVGDGIVVDVSKHFTKIISFDKVNKTVTVQPGVIRDELNRYLEPHGLFFGPNTSTSNRCMIGGMVGNNSSGTTSIQYGVTRDKLVQLKTLLSDGNEAVFNEITAEEFSQKRKLKNREGDLYRSIFEELNTSESQKEIRENYPKPEIHRRNTGYALDALLDNSVFEETSTQHFNMCKLLAGSEGTLALTTEITLKLDELPPANGVMIAAHFESIEACLEAVVPAMKHKLYACEMMDKVILDCTLNNREQQKNRFFIAGDPKAILMLEVRAETIDQARKAAVELIATVEASGLSYAYPTLEGSEISQALELRKAGLGLLGNIVGDRKAVACIEDTAVALEDLAPYIKEFSVLMAKFRQDAVYYAHAGAGELHLRPILNLKRADDVILFRQITTAVAQLVKKYKGSMSGEHGDGLVRGEFVALMLGSANYERLKRIKNSFDPQNIFNPGKLVNAGPMDAHLRYTPDRDEPEIETLMDFSDTQGILRAAEQCNGSGDCRKMPEAGGTMCPSYRATRDEKDSTRGRANTLREILTNSERRNSFNHKELKNVFDLCLSCKACASECPSNVDVAALKAEFEYQYKKENGSSLRTRAFAFNAYLNKFAAVLPSITNGLYKAKLSGKFIRKTLEVAPERSLPPLAKKTLRKRFKRLRAFNPKNPIKTVYLFADEFTNYLDAQIGEDAVVLLQRLNYEVRIVTHAESGRSFISKGFLKYARKAAQKNIQTFKDLIDEEHPLIGVEPSAILGFRDEYIRLAKDVEAAKKLAKNTFTIDEFLNAEIKAERIKATSFTTESKKLKIHGHCHQKALSGIEHTFNILNLPANFKPTIIPSGCCGMAGSFGYEKEHYDLSMQIGEQTLFPAVRKATNDTLIVAPGTSCRHQIKDGTQREAVHPVTVLKNALV